MTILLLQCPPLLARPSTAHGRPPAFRRIHLLKPVSASFSSFPTSGGAPNLSSSSQIPARDRVIDFGRHRGRMLGTLPSSYLAWVSKNLRARDYEEWARLADEVLRDPVYRDRLEWEAAERVLTGVGLRAAATAAAPSESAVAELLGITERFGWDNDDKDGWSRVDFQLLGTSGGGRIPRLRAGGGAKNAADFQKDSRIRSHGGDARPASPAAGAKKSSIKAASSSEKPMFADRDCFWVHEARKPAGGLNGTKVGCLSNGSRFTAAEQDEGEEEEEESSGEEWGKNKREERRERRKQTRRQQMRMLRKEVGVDADGGDRAAAGGQTGGGDGGGYRNPFPGRGALLGKIGRRRAC